MQLISELGRLPAHLPVRVCLSHVIYQDSSIELSPDCHSILAAAVIHEGNHVLIESE